jgi:hypothetical protein
MMIQENTAVKAYPLQIMPDGRAIFPQEFVRQLSPTLNSVCLFQIGDLALLLSTPPRLMELTQDFANLIKNKEVSLDNLLEGLQEKRLAIWQEYQDNNG